MYDSMAGTGKPAKLTACLSHLDDLDAKMSSEKQNPFIIETHTVMIMLHLDIEANHS